MMSEYILINGDKANYDKTFGAAKVDAQPGILTASGPATMKGKNKLCVLGDEATALVACTYKTETYPIPGMGMLKISSLANDQTTKKTRCGAKPVLLVGSLFKATFVVMSPAQKPTATGLEPDLTQQYLGNGTFTSENKKFTGV